MLFCENCGNKVSETAKFCSSCGEKINIVSSVPEIQPDESLWSLDKFLEENPPNEKGIITCPRCLGKGTVEAEDIERLSMKLFWEPGECQYCEGVGLVNIKKTAVQSIEDSGFTEIQRKNLETLVSVAESRRGAYCFYNEYEFEQYFGQLLKNYSVYLRENIPAEKLNSFISKYQVNSGDKFDAANELTPYMFFEDTEAKNGEDGILLVVLDRSDDWWDNGNIILIINKNTSSFYRALYLIDKMDQEEAKIKIEYCDSGTVKNVQFSFKQSAPILSAIIDFYNANNIRNESNTDVDLNNQIYYDFEKFFNFLTGENKVYLAENIPSKKLNAFKERIKSSFGNEPIIDNCNYNVYFDATTWGKGDDGYLIATDSNNILLLYLAPYNGAIWRIPFNEILEIQLKGTNLRVRIKDNDLAFDFYNQVVLQALINFYESYFVSNLNEEDDKYLDDEDQDKSPIKPKDGAGIR